MLALLTHLDHPDQVLMNCSQDEVTGLPHRFAGSGLADIVVTPAPVNGRRFRVVCEVSANKAMSARTYRRQLGGGLKHAKAFGGEWDVDVVYVFVANLKKIREDKILPKIYRKFVEDPENELEPMGSIRLILMRASDIATAVKRLVQLYDEDLGFVSHVLAELFETLREILLDDNIPDETDWMAHKMVEIVRAGNANEEGLFAGAASGHPAMG